MNLSLKPDWPLARQTYRDWWSGRGLAVYIHASRPEPVFEAPDPGPPADLEQQWLDIDYRVARDLHHLSRTWFGGVAMPHFAPNFGPGSLGLLLGCRHVLEPETIWFGPVMEALETHPPLGFRPEGFWWEKHRDYIRQAREASRGRALVALPDLIENIDTLAQLRGTDHVLLDLLDDPDSVRRRLEEIEQAWFACYDALYELVQDDDGGCYDFAFTLWAPGKTCKIQCDLSCMISPDAFRTFVVPGLTRQCEFLDYSLYHLDGTTALQHVDALLEIAPLDAIEWTPQAGQPQGGSPHWYDLYRRIKQGGKRVQAVGVKPEEVLPLIDAVGPEGLFIRVEGCVSMAEGEALLARL